MEIKGMSKDLLAYKPKIIFQNWLGGEKELPYEKIKRIEYFFAPTLGTGFLKFTTRTNEKENFEFRKKCNDDVLKLIDILRKKYTEIEYIEYDTDPRIQPHVEKVTSTAAKAPSGGLACPKCKGHNIDLWSDEEGYKISHKTSVNLNPLHPLTVFNTKEVKKEKKSAAKIGLAVMTGGVSVPFTGTKTKKHNQYYCRDCGNRWIGK